MSDDLMTLDVWYALYLKEEQMKKQRIHQLYMAIIAMTMES